MKYVKNICVIQNFFPFSEFLVFNSFIFNFKMIFNFKTNQPQIDSLLTKDNKVSLLISNSKRLLGTAQINCNRIILIPLLLHLLLYLFYFFLIKK